MAEGIDAATRLGRLAKMGLLHKPGYEKEIAEAPFDFKYKAALVKRSRAVSQMIRETTPELKPLVDLDKDPDRA